MNQFANSLLGSLGGLGIGAGLGLAQAKYQQQNMVAQIGAMQAQIFNWSGFAAMPQREKTPEEIKAEEERYQCAMQMIDNPRVRSFMENALPIEWCHRLYPEAYRAA